jgi:hypothetical protein
MLPKLIEIIYTYLFKLRTVTKGVNRSLKSKKKRKYNDQRKMRKGQTMIYKTLHRKLEIEQHEPYLKATVNPGASEG